MQGLITTIDKEQVEVWFHFLKTWLYEQYK